MSEPHFIHPTIMSFYIPPSNRRTYTDCDFFQVTTMRLSTSTNTKRVGSQNRRWSEVGILVACGVGDADAEGLGKGLDLRMAGLG